MQSVSDDNVRKRLIEKPRFELAAKDVHSDWEDATSSGRAFHSMCIYVKNSPVKLHSRNAI